MHFYWNVLLGILMQKCVKINGHTRYTKFLLLRGLGEVIDRQPLPHSFFGEADFQTQTCDLSLFGGRHLRSHQCPTSSNVWSYWPQKTLFLFSRWKGKNPSILSPQLIMEYLQTDLVRLVLNHPPQDSWSSNFFGTKLIGWDKGWSLNHSQLFSCATAYGFYT